MSHSSSVESDRNGKAMTFAPHKRLGLTLLELIVALAILAALSTVAVRALDPLADQARYESTQLLLDELRNVTFGAPSARQINGHRIVSGFVADTGRLPSDLAELTTQPLGVIAHAMQSFDSNRDSIDDVTLSSGWKGPYLHLSAGQTEILDGWGHPPQLSSDGSEFHFTSLGSDRVITAAGQGYQADFSVTVGENAYMSNVSIRLFAIDADTRTRIDPAPVGTERVGILFYGVNANGGTTGAIEETLLLTDVNFEANRMGVLHGPAAARGILWSDNNGDSLLDSGEPILLSSYVHYFTILSDSDLRIEMELR